MTGAPVAPGRLPAIGHAFQLWRRPITFLESLRMSGDIVRVDIGSWPVHVVSSPDLIRKVLAGESRHFGRGRVFERLRPVFGNGLVTTDGDFHRKQRRLMQPAFQRNEMTTYARIVRDQAQAMVSSWDEGRTIEVNKEMRQMALLVVARMIFSGDLGRWAIAEVQRSLPVILEGMIVRYVIPKALDRLPIPPNRRFDAAAARLRAVVDEVITWYRATDEPRTDILSLLLACKDPETGDVMSDEQVRDEVITIMLAGAETSANVLSWLFHELGRHPVVEERLHAEVDQVVGSRPAGPADVAGLAYTNRVFQETVRLHSPLLFTRRALAPVELGGFTIPSGAEVAYSPYALHRDPAYFPRPVDFDPDRWDTPHSYRPDLGGFMPFGAGPHKCIGDSFAVLEIIIAVANVASRWRLVPAPGVTVREVVAGFPQPEVLPMIPVARR